MASGGRPPNSAPSLPLHRSPPLPSDSLQTPDTSSLFLSSLGDSKSQSPQPSDFSSLEELLNFTGISTQVSSSPSPSPSPSLDTLAQDVEQRQDTTPIGPPKVKRLRSTNSTSLLSTHSLPPNIHVCPLSSPETTVSRTLPSLSWTTSDTIPSLLPASSQSVSLVATAQHSTTHLPSMSTGAPNSTTHLPSVATGLPHTTTYLPTSVTSTTAASLGVSFPINHPAKCVAKVSSSLWLAPSPNLHLTSSPNLHLTSSPIVPSVLGQTNSLFPLVVSGPSSTSIALPTVPPSSLTSTSTASSGNQSVFSSVLVSSGNCLLTPVATTSLSVSSHGTTQHAVPTTTPRTVVSTTSLSNPSPLTPNTHLVGTHLPVSTPPALPSRPPVGTQLSSGFSLPSHPVQRALLVQLVQAYRQCTALGDTQGQARVKAQLNVLLQAQQKLGVTNSSLPPTVSDSTSSHPPTSTPSPHIPFTTAQMNPISQVKTNNFLQSKPSLSLPAFSTSSPFTPLTPSLLSSSVKGLESTRTVVSATNSQSVAIGTGTRSNFSLGTSVSVAVSTSSSQDRTISTVTPIISSQNRVPPPASPASALKAAALYNLRLKQLQLFLQSLPEEQRPRSIPELKALIQRSGGQLSALAQPPASSAVSLPSLIATSTSPSTAPSLSNATSSVVPTLLPSTPSPQPASVALPSTTGRSTLQPTVGQCLPLLTRGFSPFTSGTTPFHATTIAPAVASQQQVSSTSVNDVLHAQMASVAVPASASITFRPPLTTSETTRATALHPLTTGAPKLTTSVPSSTTIGASVLPQPPAPPTTASHNEPIKPGVPTPLPPGVNPETLAVLCRMPDAELQKLNLPVDLMTAIRVWRGQHSSTSQRGRKPAGQQSSGLPVIIPPPAARVSQSPSLLSAASVAPHPSFQSLASSQPSSSDQLSLSTSGPVTINSQLHVRSNVPVSGPSLPPPSVPPHGYPPSRPLTRHQLRTEQTKAEKERVAALNKVLQSSEEARIAYRFNMLREKMTTQLMAPDCHTPFKSLHDVIARLLPYHMWSEAEPPPGAIEKADAVYESVAQVLMSRSQGLMSNYQHLIYHDAQRDSEAVMSVCLERFFLASEKEHREQETQERQQAAQIAADLSLIAGDSTLNFDTDFTLGDVMNSDPMLTFEPGIT